MYVNQGIRYEGDLSTNRNRTGVLVPCQASGQGSVQTKAQQRLPAQHWGDNQLQCFSSCLQGSVVPTPPHINNQPRAQPVIKMMTGIALNI